MSAESDITRDNYVLWLVGSLGRIVERDHAMILDLREKLARAEHERDHALDLREKIEHERDHALSQLQEILSLVDSPVAETATPDTVG